MKKIYGDDIDPDDSRWDTFKEDYYSKYEEYYWMGRMQARRKIVTDLTNRVLVLFCEGEGSFDSILNDLSCPKEYRDEIKDEIRYRARLVYEPTE